MSPLHDSDPASADRLSRIEQEVMGQVATTLPAEMLLLDEVQQMPSR